MKLPFDGIRAVIFDLDDTLLSYQWSEAGVLTRIFAENGISMTPEMLAHTWAISWEEWDRLRLSETDTPEIAEHFHRIYREYLVIFFDVLNRTYSFREGSECLARKFVDYMGDLTPYCAGAQRLLAALAPHYRLAVATNGLSAMQNPRLDRIPVQMERFISEEVGAVKPARRFFETVLDRLQLSAEECLFIGDSLRSDMAGAIAVGMRTVWVNPKGRSAGALQPDQIVASLDDLLE